MIKPAQLQWSEGSPVSTQFDDVYFSKASGIDETRYVFLEQNQLPSQWKELKKTVFTIAETGFGTGLNFLCAWQLWQQHSQPQQTLHFVSVEKFPLDKHSLKLALQPWTELTHLSQQLIDAYPPLVAGWHTIHFSTNGSAHGDVVLHLFLGDISHWLDNMESKVDAWFLDGFAPSKNPEMWNDHLFHSMARLSDAHTTVATFTAAGLVRRGLQAAGFKTNKAKGFGKKREMLTAQFQHTQGPPAPKWLVEKPWFVPPEFKTKQSKSQQHALVIGAGISGCASAYSLAQRGWQVTLVDKKNALAAGASGNAQGVLYAKLASDMNMQSEFYLSGYLYSLDLLHRVLPDKTTWDDCGVLQLAFSEKELKRQQQFCQKFDLSDVVDWVDNEQASTIAGVPIEQGGLYFKSGAWVYPKAWCQALVDHPNIDILLNHEVASLKQNNQQWTVQLNSSKQGAARELTTDAVIVCSAFEANKLAPLSFLPTQPIAGQVSQCDVTHSPINTVLCGDSYVTPSHLGKLNFGATYRLKSADESTTQADHDFNLNKLKANFPGVANTAIQFETLQGRTSVRCSTPDYVPIVGAVCHESLFKQQFANLTKSKHWKFYEAAPYLHGLYVNLGHGSRGLSSAPLCAELLAAQINNETWPMAASHAKMLNPNRFLVNQIIKGQ